MKDKLARSVGREMRITNSLPNISEDLQNFCDDVFCSILTKMGFQQAFINQLFVPFGKYSGLSVLNGPHFIQSVHQTVVRIFCCMDLTIDDYAKDGGPEVVWHLCSFYQDPLRS